MEGGPGTFGERSALTGQLKSPSMDFSTGQAQAGRGLKEFFNPLPEQH